MGCGQSAELPMERAKADSRIRRSSSGLLENLVHEEFDKDISEYYDVHNTHILGEGVSGQIRLCTHRKTGLCYALKTLLKGTFSKSHLDKLREEIRIMASLDHPNILRVNECFEDDNCIKLVLDLCRGGDLLDRLHSQANHKYTEKVACRYVLSMVKAIRYLHDHHIVHRDLKLENFLFETDDEKSELILIDFGLSQNYCRNSVITRAVGTPYYVAPEVLKGTYSNKCDVWSLGVITYMLLSGTLPFIGDSDYATLQKVKIEKLKFKSHSFANISSEAKDFIKQCLTRDVSLRPSAEQLLDHPWFADLNEESHAVTPSLDILTRLVSYHERSTLTKVCMEVVAHTLDAEQISSLRAQFQALDTHNRGEILFSDLKAILDMEDKISAANMEVLSRRSEEALEGMVIKYHEFLASTISRRAINDNNLRVAFEKMSDHGDVITHASILDLLGATAGDDTVSRMMREVDVDPASDITFNKFKAIMQGGAESSAVSHPHLTQRPDSDAVALPPTLPPPLPPPPPELSSDGGVTSSCTQRDGGGGGDEQLQVSVWSQGERENRNTEPENETDTETTDTDTTEADTDVGHESGVAVATTMAKPATIMTTLTTASTVA